MNTPLPCQIRSAIPGDLDALLQLEHNCFETDRLSRRSFKRFIQPEGQNILIASRADTVLGYILLLYRHGTSLARIYSLAVAPEHQGQGIARQLMQAAEELGRERFCAFLRLEVNVNNAAAIALYQKLGYRRIALIKEYYEDHSDALRMEKGILSGLGQSRAKQPFYKQSTDFTCGPASLMMAMRSLKVEAAMDRLEELQIWREATTIYMTSGHGGCSAHGLALSAWQRGFAVELLINQSATPFVDGVRDADKKAVIELVHEQFLHRLKDTQVQLLVRDWNLDDLRERIARGDALLALISTWRLNRNKAPHWVFIAAADEQFVYINDPDQEASEWQSQLDFQQVPIRLQEFMQMSQFGRKKLRCLLSLSRR